MNEIIMSLSSLPLVLEAGMVANTKPFIPKTRTLPCHVIRYITQGSMEIIEDEETYLLKPGSVLMLSAGHQHYSNEWASPNTNWFYIHFYVPETKDPAIEFKDLLPLSTSSSLLPKDYDFSLEMPKFVQLPPGNPIRDKFEKLVTYFQSDSPARFGYQNAILLEILMGLTEAKLEKQYNNPKESTISSILHYLNDHVSDPFHSDQISAAMNLNYKYLCDLFKKNTGTTIQQYHTMLKMKEAERYLKTTELTISEISEKLGYQDPLYFSNVFKKNHAISPKKFRQKNHSFKVIE